MQSKFLTASAYILLGITSLNYACKKTDVYNQPVHTKAVIIDEIPNYMGRDFLAKSLGDQKLYHFSTRDRSKWKDIDQGDVVDILGYNNGQCDEKQIFNEASFGKLMLPNIIDLIHVQAQKKD
jgi:hypothetical protein